MINEFVTRLRRQAVEEGFNATDWTELSFDVQNACDEIERLRAIIQDIANAVTDEGIKPGYHKQQVNYVRTMWNPLWQAISKAVKEVRSD